MSSNRICNMCKREILRSELDDKLVICPFCGSYMRIHARNRIELLEDKGSFQEWDANLKLTGIVSEEGYIEKLLDASKRYNLNDAIVTGEMDMGGSHIAIGVMDSRFMMASMGYLVGEKVTRLFERATKNKIPVIIFCCSGGARMQEGIISLMQMSKTAAAVKKHSKEGLLYISILTNPTMGGVTASFATLADIILAEKGATIGFTGSRVIEQNIGVKLPEEFQTAEFQLQNGYVDEVVSRKKLKDKLKLLLDLHKRNITIRLKKNIKNNCRENFKKKVEPWEKVKIARSITRPTSKEYIDKLFESFVELKGDRVSGDDPAIIAGIAKYHGLAVTVIGQEKGKRTLNDALYRNWGMPLPCGYRKVMRLMKQAEKFGRPIICLVDTVGAACGKEAKKEGQGSTIANLLGEVSNFEVPILSIIIGEGCSGGALALCSGDEVWMMENSVYSILSPEGYASIVWRDNTRAKEAANMMRLGAEDLYELEVIDKIIEEKEVVSSENLDSVCELLDNEIVKFLIRYRNKKGKDIVEKRYQRFRKY